MPTYFNCITQEIESIENVVDFYLVSVKDKYKFCVTPEDLNLNKTDMLTSSSKFWPLTLDQVQANLSLLFPDDHVRSELLTSREVNEAFNFDPVSVAPLDFVSWELRTNAERLPRFIAALDNQRLLPQYIATFDNEQQLPHSVTLLDQVSVLSKRNATYVLFSCAQNFMLRGQIAALNGIQPLVTLLNSRDGFTKRYAVAALTFLMDGMFCSVSIKNTVIENHGIPALISLLGSKDADTKTAAVGALSKLVAHPASRDIIREHQGITPLIVLLSAEDKQSKRFATAALCDLVVDNDANINAVRELQGIAPLIALLDYDYLEVQQSAVGALYTLVSNPANREVICGYNGIDALRRLLSSKDTHTTHQYQNALICQLIQKTLDVLSNGASVARSADNVVLTPTGNTRGLHRFHQPAPPQNNQSHPRSYPSCVIS